jgi:hypothetical protein
VLPVEGARRCEIDHGRWERADRLCPVRGSWLRILTAFGVPRIALRAVLAKEEDRARRVCKAEGAMDSPAGMPPVPMWVRARRGAMPFGTNIGGGGSGGAGLAAIAGSDRLLAQLPLG